MKYETIKCPICNKEDFKKIPIEFKQFPKTELSICKNDSLVLLSKRATKIDYIDYYQNKYDIDYRPNDMNIRHDKGLKNSTITFKRIVENINTSFIHNILDIGSGPGYNLNRASELFDNIQCYAVEPSLSCQKIIQNNGYQIFSNDFEEKWDNDIKFDLIVSRHSFEHSLNPNKVLKNIYNTLSENGHIYIAVPNMMKPKLPLANYWFRVVHTFYFSLHSLNILLRNNNLETIATGQENNEFWIIAKKSKQNDISLKIVRSYKQEVIIKYYCVKEKILNIAKKVKKLLK